MREASDIFANERGIFLKSILPFPFTPLSCNQCSMPLCPSVVQSHNRTELQSMPSACLYSSYFGRSRNCYLMIDCICCFLSWSSFKYASPPHWRVKWPRSIMQRWIDIREEVPDVPDHYSHYLIFRNCAV